MTGNMPGAGYMYAATDYANGKNVTVRHMFANISENTTAHGMPHVRRARGSCKKVFWFILTLGSLGALGYNIYNITELFARNQVNVAISLSHEEELQFPAVSICNMSPIRQSLWEEYVNGTSNKKRRRKREAPTPKNINLACSAGWVMANNTCLLVDLNASVSWSEALDLCSSSSSQLLLITNPFLQIYIQSMINGSEIWTGLTRKAASTTFKWPGESGAPKWVNWELGEPSYGSSMCVRAQWDHAYRWMDMTCSKSDYRAACSVDMTGVCPSGWTDSGTRCYKVSVATGNAADGQKFCKSQYPGADLAKIESNFEQEWLVNNTFVGNISYWIGLQRSESSISWPSGDEVVYTNWGPGEPPEITGCMYLNINGSWAIGDCAQLRGYICQREPQDVIAEDDSPIATMAPPVTVDPNPTCSVTCNNQYIPKIDITNTTLLTAPSLVDEALPVEGSDYPEKPALREDFQSGEDLLETLADLDDNTKRSLGYTLQDMLIDCQFEGSNCRYSDFEWFFNPLHGNCYTFNAGWNNTEVLKLSKQTGRRHGLHLTINLNQDDYSPATSSTAGVRVVVHPGNRMPFPEDEGITVPPGAATYISLTQTNIARLSHPYGACIDTKLDNSDRNVYEDNTEIEYSVMGCQKTCVQKAIIEECYCADSYYPHKGTGLPQAVNVCSTRNLKQDDCRYRVKQMFQKNEINCDCPNPCNSTIYSLDLSVGQWPSDVQRDAVLDKLAPQIIDLLTDPADQTKFSRNLLKLEIFYQEFNFENIIERPAYLPGNFASDLGGVLGLWFGLSALTICEFLEFLIDLCVYGGILWWRDDDDEEEDAAGKQEAPAERDEEDEDEEVNVVPVDDPSAGEPVSTVESNFPGGLTKEQMGIFSDDETKRKKPPSRNPTPAWGPKRPMKNLNHMGGGGGGDGKASPPPYYKSSKAAMRKTQTPPPAYQSPWMEQRKS